MWRPRGDRERFIGSYDPEHEMPDPDRGRGERWQSDAYRHNAHDSRFAYRWNPDRVEGRYEGPRHAFDRDRYEGDARDRERFMNRGGGSGYGNYGGNGGGHAGGASPYGGGQYWDRSGFDRGYDTYRDRNDPYRDRNDGDYGRGFAGGYGGGANRGGNEYDRPRDFGGYDRGRDYSRGSYGGGYSGSRGGSYGGSYGSSYGDDFRDRGYGAYDDDERASWGGYGRDNDREPGSWGGYGRDDRDRWRR